MQFLRFDTATRAAAVGGVTTLVDIHSISFKYPQSVFILADITQLVSYFLNLYSSWWSTDTI